MRVNIFFLFFYVSSLQLSSLNNVFLIKKMSFEIFFIFFSIGLFRLNGLSYRFDELAWIDVIRITRVTSLLL